MEKRTPHVRLARIKELVRAGTVSATRSALLDADAMGLDFTGMCQVVLSLTGDSFYKSMTTYADHRIWQDVYHPILRDGRKAYLKVTVIDDLLIVSFKER